MGVRTTADEHLDNAREHLKKCIEELSEIFINECSGHDDYTREFRTKWEMAFYELARLRNSLK